jgi:hypothetical protein
MFKEKLSSSGTRFARPTNPYFLSVSSLLVLLLIAVAALVADC